MPETQAAVAALPSQQLWRCYGVPDFVGDVVDFLRDPLAVLRSRALRQLPPGELLEIRASHPAEFPLLLLLSLRDQPPQRSVLIQLNDTGPRELLRLRWQAALRLCEQQLVGRRPQLKSEFEQRGLERDKRLKLLKKDNERLAALESNPNALVLNADSSSQTPPATGSN